MRLGAVMAAGATLTLTACGSSATKATSGGSSSGSPQEATQSAFHNTASQSSLGLTFSLGLTAAQIKSLSKNSKITDQQAQTLADTSIVMTESTGHGEALGSKQALTDKNNSFQFGLKVGSDTPIEIRYVGQAAYARLQIQQLVSHFGGNSSKLSGDATKINSEASKLDSYVPGLSALAQGNWVEIAASDLQQLSGMAKALQTTTGSAAASQPSASQMTQLRNTLFQAFDKNTTFSDAGTADGKHHYKATAMIKPLVDDLGTALQGYMSSVPVAGTKYSTDLKKAEAQIPAGQTAVIDVYTANSKVSEVAVDVNQFAPASKKASQAVPLKLDLTQPGSVNAPGGATKLDLSKLPTMLQQMMGGLSGLGGSSATGQTTTSTP